MPAYDYRCTTCDERFEVTRASSDPAEIRCPACDGATKRIFTPVGVHFKGSGFYSTDNKAKSPAADKSATSPDSKASESTPAPCAAATKSEACASCPAAAES